MNELKEVQKVNDAIVQHLGPALPWLRQEGPSVDLKEMEAKLGGSVGAGTAAKVMALYKKGTEMCIDWRSATDESVRADLRILYDAEEGLSEEATEILISCSLAFGW